MIIFLDIDGVLVTGRANMPGHKPFIDWNVDKEAVEALNYLLSRLEDPKIVISSAWRLSGLKRMQEYLKDWQVNAEVIGITPIAGFSGNRSHEIDLWIEDNKYAGDYIVIDDENFDLLSIMPEKLLFVEDGWNKEGLTKKMVDNFLHWRQKSA